MEEFDFYKAICQRPLIDVVQEKEEQEFWGKSFENSNDITLYSWRNDWINNTRENIKNFGYFNRDHSVKVFFNELINKPIILVGAGPTLAKNIEQLKKAKELGITIMASHHALMYMARDEYQIKPDFVVALDAGKMWDDYFSFGKLDVKDVPLLCEQTCNSEHIKKWEGPVYFFKSAHPDKGNIAKFLKMELDRLCPSEKCGSTIEVGGHAMGAMLSLARGVMKTNTIIFCGADYCFDKAGEFYPFDHKIDKVVVTDNPDGTSSEKPAAPERNGMIFDIFGNSVWTSNAYLQFKNILDLGIKINSQGALATQEDLEFINACEGGSLGALKGGLSKWMHYLKLEDAIQYSKNKMSIPKEVN